MELQSTASDHTACCVGKPYFTNQCLVIKQPQLMPSLDSVSAYVTFGSDFVILCVWSLLIKQQFPLSCVELVEFLTHMRARVRVCELKYIHG